VISSSAADECNTDEICAIVNCDAPNATILCPRPCADRVNDDPECNADFGFVADVSKSVENHWDDEKRFMKKLIQSIVISERGGRAAVTTFSNSAELQIKFDDHTSYPTFETALEQLPYVGSTTRIDLGLDVALEEMFQESNGMRSNVHKTMVLITDGQQTRVNYDLFRKKFNEARIRVLVIAVGNFRRRDVRHLVSDDADLYLARDFNILLSDAFINSITFCGEFVEKTPCRDKHEYCATYVNAYGDRICKSKWFVDKNGRYGCTKSCGLCEE
jgi:hypothetical protein